MEETTARHLRRIVREDRWLFIKSWLGLTVFGLLLGLKWWSVIVPHLGVAAIFALVWAIVMVVEYFRRRKEAKTAREFDAWPQYIHPSIGAFTLDWKSRDYICQCKWIGDTPTLHLQAGTREAPVSPDAVTTLDALWNDVEEWNRRFRENLVTNLLEAHNTACNAGEVAKSADDFLAEFKLESIHIYEEGDFVVYYDCGDLFGDHSIQIWGNLRDGLRPASEVG